MRKTLLVAIVLLLSGCETVPPSVMPDSAGAMPPSATMPAEDQAPSTELPPPADDSPTVIPLSTNVARRVEPGDTWTYQYSARRTETGTSRYAIAEGTLRDFVADSTDAVFGKVVLISSSGTERITEGDGAGDIAPFQTHLIYVRLSNGRLQLVGRNAGSQASYITSPEGGAPLDPDDALDVGDTFLPPEVVYDDGVRVSSSFIVTAIEVVEIPLGVFEAYRVEHSSTLRFGNEVDTQVGTSWRVPAIGRPIKSTFTYQGTISYGFPVTEQYTEEMTSTSVPF